MELWPPRQQYIVSVSISATVGIIHPWFSFWVQRRFSFKAVLSRMPPKAPRYHRQRSLGLWIFMSSRRSKFPRRCCCCSDPQKQEEHDDHRKKKMDKGKVNKAKEEMMMTRDKNGLGSKNIINSNNNNNNEDEKSVQKQQQLSTIHDSYNNIHIIHNVPSEITQYADPLLRQQQHQHDIERRDLVVDPPSAMHQPGDLLPPVPVKGGLRTNDHAIHDPVLKPTEQNHKGMETAFANHGAKDTRVIKGHFATQEDTDKVHKNHVNIDVFVKDKEDKEGVEDIEPMEPKERVHHKANLESNLQHLDNTNEKEAMMKGKQVHENNSKRKKMIEEDLKDMKGDKKLDHHHQVIEAKGDPIQDIFGNENTDKNQTFQDQDQQQEQLDGEQIVQVQEKPAPSLVQPGASAPSVPTGPQQGSQNDKTPIQNKDTWSREIKAAPGSSGGYDTVPMFGPAQLDLGSGASTLMNMRSSIGLAVALVVVVTTM
ncbi:MAG: hypothetical protein J3Q66DRAFT_436401 [Benniella sp.]|nr:MAG: hypothetical protein J3Q66DRAFT_436401 [Benniella sp.]